MPITWMRRWYFETYFHGQQYIEVQEDKNLDRMAVASLVEVKYFGGNWDQKTLRKGAKVKLRKKQ